MILGLVMLYSLSVMEKEKNDAEVRSIEVNRGHAESDLERREREEKELGHSLWPYVQLLKQNALHPPSAEEIITRATKGLCAIDPYSKCFSEDEYQKEQASLVTQYTGIGILFTGAKTGARITDVRLRSPAEKAGLRIGDVITHVVVGRQRSALAGLTEQEQIDRLGGSSATMLSLVLSRNGKILFSPPMMRAGGLVPTVDRVYLPLPHYGYLHIRRFTLGQTASELKYALGRLKKNGALYGVVIDLRGNLGGIFSEAVDMAGFFLDGGVIATTFDRSEGRKIYTAPPGDILRGIPLVLLVDKNSASSSELFVGALVDRDIPRALLMGEKTYGKGVGQTITTLQGGGKVKFTSFEFFTPKGNAVQGKGFTPDPALLTTFPDLHADDPWQGAALKYLAEAHRAQKNRK